jgi:hypothetical protein
LSFAKRFCSSQGFDQGLFKNLSLAKSVLARRKIGVWPIK